MNNFNNKTLTITNVNAVGYNVYSYKWCSLVMTLHTSAICLNKDIVCWDWELGDDYLTKLFNKDSNVVLENCVIIADDMGNNTISFNNNNNNYMSIVPWDWNTGEDYINKLFTEDSHPELENSIIVCDYMGNNIIFNKMSLICWEFGKDYNNNFTLSQIIAHNMRYYYRFKEVQGQH